MNNNIAIVESSETLVVLSATCVECYSHGFSLTVKYDAFMRWVAGSDLVQNIFPDVTAADCELFFGSGICGACWDIIFPDFD